ncbi:MAG: glycoside hydrolase family 97 protein [Cyclobacteriaceae bacterium]|nr:glycoside hydrolase family 97 protein [Cyclobacteriaceae bacterium]
MKPLLFVIALSCMATGTFAQSIQSPNGRHTVAFQLTPAGEPTYQLTIDGKPVVKPGKLGLSIQNLPALTRDFKIEKTDTSTSSTVWKPAYGEVREIKDHHRELAVHLRHVSNVSLILRFRVFNDGLGFRYEIPAQPNLTYFIVTDEHTEFRLNGNHKAFWIPGDYDTNKYPYSTTLLSEVDALTVSNRHTEIGTRSPIGKNYVQTPLMMHSGDGLYINIHEAALVDYSAMQLQVDQQNFTLTSHLVPDAVGNKAYVRTPFKTPWRTILVSNKAVDLLNSKTILNLNEPSKITDTNWIKPQKFVGVWWEMHIGTATWDYAGTQDMYSPEILSNLKPTGKHGATTANTKRYIDFAARHGFDGVLIEGWNTGWEDWFGKWKEDVFDFVTPYPDFDVAELKRYAASKDVKLIMHHETSGSVTNYERRMQDAYRFMKENGYETVKTGYVGRIIPRGEHHDGQWMVNHYNRVAQALADQKIMLDAHEPVPPTGLHRTYPNWMASEAARGNEFNAWSVGNPPEHETILPFTRLLGGPMDYTPGIFEIKMSAYKPGTAFQVHTTLAKQLALYVTMYSPLQMVADLPENYESRPDAFQFIKDVPVDWDDSRVLAAEPGDYIITARKGKGENTWYVGAVTDEEKRAVPINFDFLNPRQDYLVTLYADALDAHWKDNPMNYTIQQFLVTHNSIVKVILAAGGGAALKIKPATEEEKKRVKRYRERR